MLKSLFFRKKSGNDELLPPPPPFPKMELEEPELEAASDSQLNEWINNTLQPNPSNLKRPKQKSSKKLSKKELKKLAKIMTKESKSAKKPTKEKPPQKKEFFDMDADFGFGRENPIFQDLDEPAGDFKLPESIKHKEIGEAEDEIASAIEGIKKHEKPFFSRLFGKKSEQVQEEIPELKADGVATIRKKIGDSRKSLMDLDIAAAKNQYIEIMAIYNKLIPQDQAEIYGEIKEIYYERKNAEKMGM